MKRVRDLATILYYLSRITAFLFFVVSGYASLVLLLYKLGINGTPLEVDNGRFIIFLPFSKIPFLLGDYTIAYLTISISIVLLYAVFLWLLSALFQVFKQEKIFIPQSVRRLTNFYRFNFYVPLLYILSLVVFKLEFRDAIVIVLLHLMLSVFIFFMATFFQQGLLLQEEQDQTL